MDLVAPLHAAIAVVAVLLESAAAVTLVVGAVLAVVRLRQGVTPARRLFGNTILLALDFTIAADLLKLASVDLGGLVVIGGVVLVRILLTVVMVWEVRVEEQKARAKH